LFFGLLTYIPQEVFILFYPLSLIITVVGFAAPAAIRPGSATPRKTISPLVVKILAGI